MPDSGDDGRPVLPEPGPAAAFDDRALDTPNCPTCLLRMEADATPGGEPYWSCAQCGASAIA